MKESTPMSRREALLRKIERGGFVDGDGVFRPFVKSEPSELLGLPVVVDPTMPEDEIHFKQGGKLVGRIYGLSPARNLPIDGLDGEK
jgi:hypothetical protein